MTLSSKDVSVLRELATKYMDIAQLGIHREKLELWKSLNRMEMQRPMVNIDQVPWVELNTDGILDCTVSDPFWRGIESTLRTTIYPWEHFPADMVIEPYISIPSSVRFTEIGRAHV